MSRAWSERPFSTLLATGLGIGMIPWAPGTWGSAEGLLLAWVSVRMEFQNAFLFVLLAALAVFILGVVTGGRTEAVAGEKDPSAVVIDEVAGQLLASAPCALSRFPSPWWLWILSFALFRLFDIWKPGPIRKLQQLPGGWGIMLDDVAAGIVSGALTYAIGSVLGQK